MSSTVPLLMRVIANSVTCATRAGLIIKETMKTGNLNIVEKVGVQLFHCFAPSAQFITILTLSRTLRRVSTIFKPKPIEVHRDVS